MDDAAVLVGASCIHGLFSVLSPAAVPLDYDCGVRSHIVQSSVCTLTKYHEWMLIQYKCSGSSHSVFSPDPWRCPCQAVNATRFTKDGCSHCSHGAMEISGLSNVGDKDCFSIMPSYQWGNLKYFALGLFQLPGCLASKAALLALEIY